MPTHSPLPSFHSTPNHSPPRSHTSSPSSSHVAEKVALSYQRARTSSTSRLRQCADYLFVSMRVPLPGSNGGGGIASGPRRELTVPVLRFLHPARPLPFFGSSGSQNFRGFSSATSSSSSPLSSKSKRNPNLSSLSPTSPTSPYSSVSTAAAFERHAQYSRVRALVAIIGTCVIVVLSIVSTLRLAGRAFRFAGDSGKIPFVDPPTLVVPESEIERIWRWEIAEGHYPSKRSPGIRFNHPEGGGSPSRAQPVNSRLVRIENPGLPKKTEDELRRERQVEAEVERRLNLKNQVGTAAAGIVIGDNSHDPFRTNGVEIVPVGPGRKYLDIPLKSGRHSQPYPPRPDGRATLDLDAIMDHCDFGEGKYVRDCLEVLRVNGGLEPPLRRGIHDNWKTTFVPTVGGSARNPPVSESTRRSFDHDEADKTVLMNSTSSTFSDLVSVRQQLTLSTGPAASHHRHPHFTPHPSHPTADPACDPAHPRLFHIFWAGPFTDKPYSAALSFLFTQHLSLSSPIGSNPTLSEDPTLCRPQLWIWINPGPASSFPDPKAERRMRTDLAKNPWSAPLLHRRFKDTIKFRLWNTTEQLDGVQEMQGWREMRLFNSGGVKYGSAGSAQQAQEEIARRDVADDFNDDDLDDEVIDGVPLDNRVVAAEAEEGAAGGEGLAASAEAALSRARESSLNATRAANESIAARPPQRTKSKDALFDRVGSSATEYDRLSVVLSDMARFVLTHRFGGVYLDADTILLRDWTELFNWHGAFAYRWSRLERYNTAVLKMARNSAIGNFIFKTAVANGLDFHPMTISRYTKDASVEGLLLRLPDALFDPAWLNTEFYQRDRPPQPYFKRFEDFFETPKENSADAVATGFDGFFKGAFSYHFHNFWWKPFDGARNFPDLGPRFAPGERLARGLDLAAKLKLDPTRQSALHAHISGATGPSPTKPIAEGVTGKGNAPAPTDGTSSSSSSRDTGLNWGDDPRDFRDLDWSNEEVEDDERDLSWATVLKRTFEAFMRGERPNMYGEWINWEEEY
ncbi:uncharacterized protein JCM15063_002932 [Sporobolomyces koalae]|uniref:uncharacterized protein n=1 Tax=Sporobolomyces koalae TaxID=500713 RepID=UPI00317F6E4A